jgi:hypothetical protein
MQQVKLKLHGALAGWFRKEELRPLEPRRKEPFIPLLKIKPAPGL